ALLAATEARASTFIRPGSGQEHGTAQVGGLLSGRSVIMGKGLRALDEPLPAVAVNQPGENQSANALFSHALSASAHGSDRSSHRPPRARAARAATALAAPSRPLPAHGGSGRRGAAPRHRRRSRPRQL